MAIIKGKELINGNERTPFEKDLMRQVWLLYKKRRKSQRHGFGH